MYMFNLFKCRKPDLDSNITYHKGQMKASQKAMDELEKKKNENSKVADHYPDLVDMYRNLNLAIDRDFAEEHENYQTSKQHLTTAITNRSLDEAKKKIGK